LLLVERRVSPDGSYWNHWLAAGVNPVGAVIVGVVTARAVLRIGLLRLMARTRSRTSSQPLSAIEHQEDLRQSDNSGLDFAHESGVEIWSPILDKVAAEPSRHSGQTVDPFTIPIRDPV